MAKQFRIGLLACLMGLLSACGGGGGGLNINVNLTAEKLPPQTPTTITVIDGYIEGAIVCVDRNKNGTCDAGETQGKTDAAGKVTLGILADEVGKYPIVANIPVGAIDSDDRNAPLVTAYTLSAPADQPAIVSPLSTLVHRLMEKDGISTAQASRQIESSVGDPRIDYIQSKDLPVRLAAKLLATMMQDPATLGLQNTATDAQKQEALLNVERGLLTYVKDKAAAVNKLSVCANDVLGQGCQRAIKDAAQGAISTPGSVSSNNGDAGADSSVSANPPLSVEVSGDNHVLDTITLTLRNIWSNIKSVVLSFTGNTSDLVDAQRPTQTINAPDSGVWPSITTAFKTAGDKVMSLVLKDGTNGTGSTVDTRSFSVALGQGSVSQKASINNVENDSTTPSVIVVDGASTRDTTPVINGTVDVALNDYYDVAVYDKGTKLTGALTYTNNKKDWRFTPGTELTQGQHLFTASVIRFDGVEGAESSPARQAIVLTTRPSVSPTNPNVLDTVTFSLSNLYSGISTVTWDFGDRNAVQTSTVTDGATSISTRYATQGSKTVTVSYRDAAGLSIATDSLTVSVAEGMVSQTVSITGASNSGNADGLALTLSGRYIGNPLSTDYSIRLMDGDITLDTAYLQFNDSLKTWSFDTGNLIAGSHAFRAVALRKSDGKLGTISGPYTVKIGNSVSVSSNSDNSFTVLDTTTLTLRNIWSNVKSVVLSFTGTLDDDVVDGQTSKTFTSILDGTWESITTAFKSAGQKIFNLVFKDGPNGTGNDLDSRRITLDVAVGTVKKIATISQITDDRLTSPFVVQEGATTNDSTPIVIGTVNEALSQYYDVAVYVDGGQLAGQLVYTDNRKGWTFTPTTPLSEGRHTLTAKVVRMDGVTGKDSEARTLTIVLYKLVPKLGGTNYEITECVKDINTGLIWEGKTSDGPRAGTHSYTNYTSTTLFQAYDNRPRSQTEISVSTNSIGYANYVNGMALCGFTDWRLPTLAELKTLVKAGFNPPIDSVWFPNTTNTIGAFYWASDSDIEIDGLDVGTGVEISNGEESYAFRPDPYSIRLVRSAP